MQHRSWIHLATIGRFTALLVLLSALVVVPAPPVHAAPITFTGTELLTRPTANSISVTFVPQTAITVRFQYGTAPGGPYTTTGNTAAAANAPTTVVLGSLSTNTKYYYRMQYSTDGGSTWETRTERSFQTARAAGSTFSFTLTSDSHVGILMGQSATWTNVAQEVAAHNPEFHFDLGDTVAMYTNVDPSDQAGANQAYIDQYQYF